MDIVRAVDSLSLAQWRTKQGRGPLGITIGNFDGVHLGHQQLFSVLSQELKTLQLGKDRPLSGLLTFEPHPRVVLQNIDRATIRQSPVYWALTPFRQKAELVAKFGFDALFAVRFNKRLAALSPEEFVRTFLVEGLGVAVVVIGHDWSFGKNRAGNPELLTELGRKFGFHVHVVSQFQVEGTRVSSSTVKAALMKHDLQELRKLLGRNFELVGRVTAGDRRGHQLGFPTANLHAPQALLPADGVYATRTYVRGAMYPSVTNIGVRPTFGGSRRHVETHVLDLGEEYLYKEHLRIEFVAPIREEQKFPNSSALQNAIRADIVTARKLLAISTS